MSLLRNCLRPADDCTGPFGRPLTRLLITAYRRRLRSVVAVVTAPGTEEIFGASEWGGGGRVEMWVRENRWRLVEFRANTTRRSGLAT